MRLSILLLIIISIAVPAAAGGFQIEGTKGTEYCGRAGRNFR
jgi:hypothetical protein